MQPLNPCLRLTAGQGPPAWSDRQTGTPLLSAEAAGHPVGTVLRCVGEIDLSSVDCLNQALTASIEAGVPALEVDLRKVVYLDSSAIKALLWAHHQQARRGGALTVRVGPLAERLCRLIGLHRILEIRFN